jgi:hypothetical protein
MMPMIEGFFVIDPNSRAPVCQNDIEQSSLSGESQKLLDHTLWPVLSPDGSRLAYLNEDPVTLSNDLYLAWLTGSHPASVMQPGVNPPIGARLFTRDSSRLIFSMVNLQPAPLRFWWERLFDIQVASAPNVSYDWYLVPILGGQPEQLTRINGLGLVGGFFPDSAQLAFGASSGLYIMSLDGSDRYRLSDRAFIGSVDWIP